MCIRVAFSVLNWEHGVYGLGPRVRVQGTVFRVQGSGGFGVKVYDSGIKV